MAKYFDKLNENHIDFIKNQKIFFVGTAMAEGKVNVSPKGMDSFRVLSPTRVIWLNATGSGNETAGHIKYMDRMTIMFCSFDGKPLILRLYGKAKAYHKGESNFEGLVGNFSNIEGMRQIFDVDLNMVQTSCGYAVPFMDFKEERTQLNSWALKQGPQRIAKYWENKNTKTIDGIDTGISEFY